MASLTGAKPHQIGFHPSWSNDSHFFILFHFRSHSHSLGLKPRRLQDPSAAKYPGRHATSQSSGRHGWHRLGSLCPATQVGPRWGDMSCPILGMDAYSIYKIWCLIYVWCKRLHIACMEILYIYIDVCIFWCICTYAQYHMAYFQHLCLLGCTSSCSLHGPTCVGLSTITGVQRPRRERDKNDIYMYNILWMVAKS